MILTALLLLQSVSPQVDPAAICSRFEAFDHDRDGQVEIASLAPVDFGDGAAPSSVEKGRRVLVMVEERLLLEQPEGVPLLPHLARLREDLAHEGFDPLVLGIEFAPSDRHQDGRYVLALREVFRAFNADQGLTGALLVGHFPDAYLVRTCNWRRRGDITLHKKSDREVQYEGVRYVRRVPEHVSQRADIVLADLDGDWESVYVQPRSRLERILAVFEDEVPAAGGVCLDVARGSSEFEDYFHISDGKLEIQELVEAPPQDAAPHYRVFLDDRAGDHECSASDGAYTNVIAHPEIHVSRIDAWGTAQSPRADIVDVDGRRLLDEHGQPQELSFAEPGDVPHGRDDLWAQDPALEQRLIAEYLDRNHAFRSGDLTSAWRPSSIACDLGSGFQSLARASTSWQEGDPDRQDVHGKPSLARFVDWMNYPAILRTIRAHSNPTSSVFGATKAGDLEDVAGKTIWSWTRRGRRLVPSLQASSQRGHLDWFLMHTLWRNGTLPEEPSFYLHTGCEGISPPNSRQRPFTDPEYGARQGAESLLLMGGGLALVGRAKVFYDEPKGFAETLGNGGTIGAAWAAYYDIESRSTWGAAGGDIGRKRSYFWSVLGDWTLRLSMAKPTPVADSKDVETWESVELKQSRLYIPKDLSLEAPEGVPLYIHFQGGTSAARANFAKMNRPGVLLASTLSGFSSAFSKPYEDPAAFRELLDSVDEALTVHAGRPIRTGPVVITFFSAGYGAVRELLKHEEHFDRIQGLVSADSIYASVVGEDIRAPEAAQMVDFQRFAQAAARGEKSFVLVHGMYPTPYASTAECADAILASVGAERAPRARTNEQGFTTASEAHVGNFHLYTFDIAAPYIHVQCMRMIPELVRRHL